MSLTDDIPCDLRCGLMWFMFVAGCIPQRYVFGLMGFLAVANAYAMRSVLSVAITEMVRVHHGKLGNKVLEPDPNACPAPSGLAKNHTYNSVSVMMQTSLAIILSFRLQKVYPTVSEIL